MSAMVSAAITLGGQLENKMLPSLDNNAAAGAPIKQSSRIRAILAMNGSFWERVVQLLASRWVERVSLEANAADALRRNRPPLRESDVKGELASLQMVLKLRRVSGNKLNLKADILREPQMV